MTKCLGTCQDERPAQPEDPLADLDLAQAGLAGRQHDQLGGQEVQPGDILGGQQTILGLLGRIASLEPGVGPGQRQSRAEHGVLHHQAGQPAHTGTLAGEPDRVDAQARRRVP
jgi:hypothetical protein